uniref:Uncharacterized protein n=1 Tax=Acrobeloides nanus TaxID=290746 RepID=A0A914E4X8_9BILA
MFAYFLVSLFALTFAAPNTSQQGCWLQAYGRGVGVPISSCPSGQVDDAGLCYTPCKDGYKGVATVCWESCPNGFTDVGVTCQKPAAYGRGAGYVSSDACAKNNAQGCEQYGALYYPKCAENFHAVGCCVCSPDCPNGMSDAGADCTKNTYDRGVGKPLGCAAGLVEDASLCYTPCQSPYNGVGPVCWTSCPPNFQSCGALCLPQGQCVDKIFKTAEDVAGYIEALTKAITDKDPTQAAEATKEAIEKLAGDLDYPLCYAK